MTFSWESNIARSKQNKIERAKIMAKNKVNPDFCLAHPDWCRDAQNDDYVVLVTKVSTEFEKKKKTVMDRRAKLVGN